MRIYAQTPILYLMYFLRCTQIIHKSKLFNEHISKKSTTGWFASCAKTPNLDQYIPPMHACRVRATDRHCRKMRKNNKFGAKNINLATTIGERKIASKFFCLAWESSPPATSHCLVPLKGIEISAIIVVPIIMTLSRGHTGKIKGQL